MTSARVSRSALVEIAGRLCDAALLATSSNWRGQGGSGLGMHIVDNIMHQMGGHVAVAAEGPGCCIMLRLPVPE